MKARYPNQLDYIGSRYPKHSVKLISHKCGLQKQMTLVGLEPTISGSVDRCLIHWATGPCDNACRNTEGCMLAHRSQPEISTASKRAHPGSNQGPADLQSAALPLSYTPACSRLDWRQANRARPCPGARFTSTLSENCRRLGTCSDVV